MPELPALVITVIIAALLFDFTNGWNDAANAIATVVSTRILSPLQAVGMAAGLNFAGAFLSTRVAKTIATDIADPTAITLVAILAAMVAAALWTGLMTYWGLPISASHALIGGIMGAVIFGHGVHELNIKGLTKILVALFVSPVMGLIAGYLLMALLFWLLRSSAPRFVSKVFGKLQLVSAGFMAFSHGTNDAQKVMGVITMALLSAKALDKPEVPSWVILLCGTVIALGTAIGGWRVIRTLGVGLLKLRPVHGFAAETAASAVLLASAGLGVPVSTTHVITSSIMGVGARQRLSAVRWGIGAKILYAWIFTLPACIVLAGLILTALNVLFDLH